MWRTVFFSSAAVCLSAGMGDLAASDAYAGTFKDSRITVELKESKDGYQGSVIMGKQTFPLEGRLKGDSLEGAFEHRGARFAFTAKLSGDVLTFTTGKTTYSLRRAGAVENPLDTGPRGEAPRPPSPPQPAGPSPSAKTPGRQPGQQPGQQPGRQPGRQPGTQPGQPPAAKQPAPGTAGGPLRLKTFSVRDRDDMIGGEALTFLAPADWKTEGGILWRVHPVMPAALAIRVFDPAGVEAMEFFPALPFSWGGYLPVTGFPQGSNYLGNEVQPPVRDFRQCILEVVLPRFRSRVTGARIVKEEELTKLAQAVKAENTDQSGNSADVSAGKIRIEYTEAGRPVEEDIYCALITVPTGNMTLWLADKMGAMRAEKGKLDEKTKILETAVSSMKLNINWYNRYAQLVQALTRAQMQHFKNVGDFSRALARTSSEISDDMRRQYEKHCASDDRLSKNYSQYTRGVEEYYDPREERPVELPSGYNDAWVNARGEYVITENPNFNPNVELEGDWRKLERRPGQ